MTHTILLLQPHSDKSSRTFSDHENVNQAIDGTQAKKRGTGRTQRLVRLPPGKCCHVALSQCPRASFLSLCRRHSTSVLAFIAGYEHRLKELNPTVRNLRYDTKDLMNYIDNLPDLGILTFDSKSKAYVPHDREWMKNRVYQHLQRSAR